jgi:hypothetical protein
MNKILIKNGVMERIFMIPYGMIQASNKLKTMCSLRLPYVICDVSGEVFEAFRVTFSDYYNNATDSNVDIKTLVTSMISNYPELVVDLMNFITIYEFMEIHEDFKTVMHDIVNNSSSKEIMTLFQLHKQSNDFN